MEKTPYPSPLNLASLVAIAVSLPLVASVSMAQEPDATPPPSPGPALESLLPKDSELPQTENFSSLAQREIIRRQAATADAERLLAEGREAYANQDYKQAADKYNQALQKVPDAPLFATRRQAFAEHLADANLALAMTYRDRGRYDEAKVLLEEVLKVLPNNAKAKRELMEMADPTYTNLELTPEHSDNIDKVNQHLDAAEGNFDLGLFDAAKREYENVLRIDQYNKTARRGMERIAAIKSDYYRAAYDQTRAELLMEVDRAWETTVPTEAMDFTRDLGPKTSVKTGVAYITEKLRRIIIPRIDFEDTTLEEAVQFLRLRAAELDTLELDPTKKGINLVIRKRNSGAAVTEDLGGLGSELTGGSDSGAMRISELRVRNVPLETALKYICDATKLRYKVDDFSVTLVPQTETGEDIFSRTFTVPPDFQARLNAGGDGGGGAPADVDPFADPGAGSTSTIKALPSIKELLTKQGIKFSDSASASLTGSTLLVTNTPTELDKVEVLVETFTLEQPKQVKITTKFVEITQENGDELGFDWVIGPFFSGDGNLVGTGGTTGNGSTRTGFDFSGPLISGVPSGDIQVSNIATAGNRSGNFAISGNSIDAILNNTNRASQSARVAPGIMSMTGLFSDGQLKVIMRGLSQKKGVDLMTAPSITARSAEKATIEIVREFIYPTEYDPPELPQGAGGGGGGFNNQQGGQPARIVTPANPTAFDVRNTGVNLEIEPVLGENNFLIDLRFVPEIVEFEGFINYGSPITTPATDEDGNEFSIVLTENRIEMPVFSTRRVNTALTIYDGYTVAIGGLLREDVQTVEDKVPILGDIPVLGRLFQTKADFRIKSNLIIFVTAQIIDPTGRPLRGSDEEEVVDAPVGPSDLPN